MSSWVVRLIRLSLQKAESTRKDLRLTAGVEMFYDQSRTHYLTEWENEAGKPMRVYALPTHGGFSATVEAFDKKPKRVSSLALPLSPPRLLCRRRPMIRLSAKSPALSLVVTVRAVTSTTTLPWSKICLIRYLQSPSAKQAGGYFYIGGTSHG